MAMCLGADAVAMESRFAITKESLLAQQMNDIVSNNEIDGGVTESDTLWKEFWWNTSKSAEEKGVIAFQCQTGIYHCTKLFLG
jgi:hypothetical protein